MTKLKDIITVQEIKELNRLNRLLKNWIKKYEFDSVEYNYLRSLIIHLEGLNEDYRSNWSLDCYYVIYNTKMHFEPVKEMYRNTNKSRYRKVYKGWELLFDVYQR